MQPQENIIALHGMWRCGSTYIWSRFRALPETYCYYEPLLDGLSRLSHRKIKKHTQAIQNKNHHPVMSLPYFAEYEPLIGIKGVKNFRRRFERKRFILKSHERDQALEKYLFSLIHNASQTKRVPVLGFNRTSLRLSWIKHNLGGYHIHIDRDPRGLWLSYQGNAERGNDTFFLNWLRILNQNATHPAFAPFLAKWPQMPHKQSPLKHSKKYCRQWLHQYGFEACYPLVFYVWALTALHALEHADLIIDMNAENQDHHGHEVGQIIYDNTGLRPEFSLNRDEPEGENPYREMFASTEEECLNLIRDQLDFSAIELNAENVQDRISRLNTRKHNMLAGLLSS